MVGTAANDTFNAFSVNATTGAAATTLSAFDNIGGAGTDTLNIYTDTGENEVQQGTVRNVEVINIFNATGGAELGNAAGQVNAAGFVGAQQIWQIGNAIDLVNVAAGVTAGFRDAAVSATVEFDGATGNVVLDNVADGSTVYFEGETLTSVTVSGSVEQDSDPAVVEVLELHDHTENAAATSFELIETLNLSLTTRTEVNLSGEFDSVVTFNAAGSTAGITTDLSSLVSLENATFGAGVDLVDAAISDEADTSFDLGAGNDVFTLDGTGDAENSLTSVTLGAGNDTFALTNALSNIVDASEENFADGLITVSDFDADADVLDVSALSLTLATLDNTEIGNIRDAASLYAAIELAADYIDTGAAEDAVVFTYEGNTYLLASADNDFTDGDGLVQLVGVTANELDAASFVS